MIARREVRRPCLMGQAAAPAPGRCAEPEAPGFRLCCAAMSEPHVVIVGGGFGGLECAKALRDAPVRVTLVDRRNHHLFQPLLYQVATAALSPASIAAPLRAVLRDQRNAQVLLGDVSAILPGRRELVLDGDEAAGRRLGYDYLVVAIGVSHAYFGHEEWAPLAPGLKSVEDALEIRRRILLAYEAAERETDEQHRKALLTFVVVGGGPTGVELAGALAEISRRTLARDFRTIDPTSARVLLVEGGPRILASFSEPSSVAAHRQLVRLGVEVHTSAIVSAIEPGAVTIKRGAATEHLPVETVLWAAGVAANPLARSLGTPLDKAGRLVVEPDLSLPGHPEVLAVGDICAFTHDTAGAYAGKPLPGLAPVAMQMGRHAASTILASVERRHREAFHYWDKGSMATIGRAAAVVEMGKLHLSGLLAWLAWLFIHIIYLIGFRTRLLVLFEWSWAYLTHQRGTRLITGSTVLGPSPVRRADDHDPHAPRTSTPPDDPTPAKRQASWKAST